MKDCIVKITFAPDHIMMFGNSYKPWEMQFEEYLYLLKRDGEYPSEIKEVKISDSPWIKWGGLKWCPEQKFQYLLNREGCQEKDPDNPRPRKYSEMKFYKNGAITKKVKQYFRNVFQGIY
ncbi:hypothetical protein [Brevibacillus brevis]|uniref:hypothetical protein n=1 Tax=Brevibacillus brevis TaxID=1393 RepID=UPI0007D8AAD3|nr:hypothetical protein [Brevibacillus brevis]